MPSSFVPEILRALHEGRLGVAEACARLGLSRSRLYELRGEWLDLRSRLQIAPSGGDHHGRWPEHVLDFLREFLPIQSPPNYQLVADELARLHDFHRARSSVEAYAKAHLGQLIPRAAPKPRIRRRFRRARFGELWQHDSSIHQWWPGAQKQVLLLTVDDHSGYNVAGLFVPADTTWAHFCHFRSAFETCGIPEAIYTDALSLFGPSSCGDRHDPKSEFQRALRGLGIAHLVAPSPQAKGKIERRFGTFQRRLVTLLSHAKARCFGRANQILKMEIQRQNSKVHPSTGMPPAEIFQRARTSKHHALRPCPPQALLDLHLSLRTTRRVNNDHTIEFDGHSFLISPTAKRYVHVLFHPASSLWVLEQPPTNTWPTILGRFSL